MSKPRPIVLVGCGRLGSAMLEGWMSTDTVDPARLIVLTPSAKSAADAARAKGASVNPSLDLLAEAEIVILAVKPAIWRSVVEPLKCALAADATVVSVMAGVRADTLSQVFESRPVARVMPTTAVAQARGVAAVWSASDAARAVAHSLFDLVADTVDLADEALIDAATAVAGSAPAFIYAFVASLAQAGQGAGLEPDVAVRLARGALRSAAAGAETDASLTDLIARIASPGGTTEAGLKAQAATVAQAAGEAVEAAIARARQLG